jgi:hypothetical protein
MIILPLIYILCHISAYIARTAFHGLLLMNGSNAGTNINNTIPGGFLAMAMDGTLQCSTTMDAAMAVADAGLLAQQTEESLCRSFHDHLFQTKLLFWMRRRRHPKARPRNNKQGAMANVCQRPQCPQTANILPIMMHQTANILPIMMQPPYCMVPTF